MHDHRCGSGLSDLFQSPFVQQFLNGGTTTCTEKRVQSGVFAKVLQKSIFYYAQSFLFVYQVKRNGNSKPQTMCFGAVTLQSPFTQTNPTIIDASSRKQYTLQTSEETPRFVIRLLRLVQFGFLAIQSTLETVSSAP
jgi:hypothetical protein